jgi:hypothetical protein
VGVIDLCSGQQFEDIHSLEGEGHELRKQQAGVLGVHGRVEQTTPENELRIVKMRDEFHIIIIIIIIII